MFFFLRMNVRVSTNKLVSGIKLKAREPKTTPRNVVLLTEGKPIFCHEADQNFDFVFFPYLVFANFFS